MMPPTITFLITSLTALLASTPTVPAAAPPSLVSATIGHSSPIQTQTGSLGIPTVDLGYSSHQASLISVSNLSHYYYNFTNIRYAAPPLGPLRFAAPKPPLDNHSAGVQDGTYGNICPQAFPTWLETALDFHDVHYYDGIGAGQTEAEDCLFLDVVVPQRVFEQRAKGRKLRKQRRGDEKSVSRGAPVVIWVYGGGFVNGDKISLTNPIGLLERAEQDAIFVAFNYRLGAFGWLAGPTLQSSNGTANVGLLDQRLAFEWVQQYIHLFGGDPTRVTVMGESAGGGSILHHVTAHGVGSSSLFQQVIVQSPAFVPLPNKEEQERAFEQFLQTANVSSLQQARDLPTEVLMGANAELIASAYYGSYIFGPAVDSDFVPNLPSKLLLQGSFDHDLRVVVGYNSDEGGLFADPTITNNSAYDAYLYKLFSYMPEQSLSYISSTLYPPTYDGSMPYTSTQQRLSLMIAEAFLTCNTYYLGHALKHQTHGYLFSVPPGLHGEDIAYTFFTGPSPNVQNKTLAMDLQQYLMQFVRTRNPNGANLPHIPCYGDEAEILNLNITDFRVGEAGTANYRCDWWQKAL